MNDLQEMLTQVAKSQEEMKMNYPIFTKQHDEGYVLDLMSDWLDEGETEKSITDGIVAIIKETNGEKDALKVREGIGELFKKYYLSGDLLTANQFKIKTKLIEEMHDFDRAFSKELDKLESSSNTIGGFMREVEGIKLVLTIEELNESAIKKMLEFENKVMNLIWKEGM